MEANRLIPPWKIWQQWRPVSFSCCMWHKASTLPSKRLRLSCNSSSTCAVLARNKVWPILSVTKADQPDCWHMRGTDIAHLLRRGTMSSAQSQPFAGESAPSWLLTHHASTDLGASTSLFSLSVSKHLTISISTVNSVTIKHTGVANGPKKACCIVWGSTTSISMPSCINDTPPAASLAKSASTPSGRGWPIPVSSTQGLSSISTHSKAGGGSWLGGPGALRQFSSSSAS
mmetsp:Transcript_20256/g.47990  ORF Transcript_20256/g.47990 Transcript_20256/m.47990 type:complete len:230 (+) Transcript_20256:397-1086(+)